MVCAAVVEPGGVELARHEPLADEQNDAKGFAWLDVRAEVPHPQRDKQRHQGQGEQVVALAHRQKG